MAIDTASRSYSDNLRRMRRYLQGRGVNIRETVIVGSTYAGDRLTVPGLHDDDRVVSVLNLSDLVDASGYLDDDGVAAVLDVFSGNKGITFTARTAGAAGNDLYIKAAAAAGASLPLSVVVGPHPTIASSTMILVNLATDANAVALTTSANSAANVRVAVLQNQAAAKLVGAVLDGTGATAWTAQAITPLAGGEDFKQGPSRASLVTGGPYDDDDVRYVARRSGADGNDVTVQYSPAAALAVTVTVSAILVEFVANETTAAAVVAAVNADADASALVLAEPAPGNPLGEGLIDTMAATNLAGGVDPGIQLSVGSAAKKLKILWLTRDEKDEN